MKSPSLEIAFPPEIDISPPTFALPIASLSDFDGPSSFSPYDRLVSTALIPIPPTTPSSDSLPPSPRSSSQLLLTSSPFLPVQFARVPPLPTNDEWIRSLPPARDPWSEFSTVRSPLKADVIDYYLHRLPGFKDSLYTRLSHQVRFGWDLGLRGPVERPFFPDNASNDDAAVRAIDQEVANDIRQGWLAGPYEREKLQEEMGINFRSNPLSVVPKFSLPGEPQRYRMIENCSFPWEEDSNGFASVNSHLSAQFSPSRHLRLATFLDLMRRLPSHARVWVGDLFSAYKQLSILPSQRPWHGILWRDQFFFRTTPCFGGRTTPGVFVCSSAFTFL